VQKVLHQLIIDEDNIRVHSVCFLFTVYIPCTHPLSALKFIDGHWDLSIEIGWACLYWLCNYLYNTCMLYKYK